MALLSREEILGELEKLNGWEFENNSILRKFQLEDFKSAVAFIVKIGMAAEIANHHPDIFLHNWNKVLITLSTHSENGITPKDISLAKEINKMYGE